MEEVIMENSPEKEEESMKREEATSNSINDCPMINTVNMDEEKKNDEESEDDEDNDDEDNDDEDDDDEDDDDAEVDNEKDDDDAEDEDEKNDNEKGDDLKNDDEKDNNEKVNDKKDGDKKDDKKEDDEDSDESSSEESTSSEESSSSDDSDDSTSDDDESSSTDNGDEEKKVFSGWPDKSTEAKVNEVRKKLIMTAQMERLNDYVDARLIEIGWKANIKNILRAEIRKNNNLTLANLYEIVKVKGKELVPESLKVEILDKIQEQYEAEVPLFTATYSSEEEEDSDVSLTS